MKYVIASDLHGSVKHVKELLRLFEAEKADKLILLGDLYYHGPRNPLPEEYDTMVVAALLNSIKDKIIAVRGNCDAEVDEMISQFPIQPSYELEMGGLIFFFTHGHKYNMKNPPAQDYHFLIYGHEHIGYVVIGDDDKHVFANPGSVSLPKNGSARSYLVLEDCALTLKDFDGNIL